MSLGYQILGSGSGDNALLVHVHTGQSESRLLFDCGEGCLSQWTLADFQAVDHLCFSHFHMDHVAGFDSFFRANYQRQTKPNIIWGPAQTIEIMHHRFQGYLWNLHADLQALWTVMDIDHQAVRGAQFYLHEAFQPRHDLPALSRDTVLFHGDGYHVEAMILDHHTPSIAYKVVESPRLNVAMDRLQSLDLAPGPWMKALKDPTVSDEIAQTQPIQTRRGTHLSLAQIREAVLEETPGQSIAYVTDFWLDEDTQAKLVPWLRGVETLVCEAQYRKADLELARRHHHMTTERTATLAAQAGVGRLVLFHLSRRYPSEQWPEILQEAQDIFPQTELPAGWVG